MTAALETSRAARVTAYGVVIAHGQHKNLIVGCVVRTEGRGWRFLPSTSDHRPGRKFRDRPEDAVPRWVGRHKLVPRKPRSR